MGLQDNYDLEGFDQKRQAALNALVACCPRKAAPYVHPDSLNKRHAESFTVLSLKSFSGISTPPINASLC